MALRLLFASVAVDALATPSNGYLYGFKAPIHIFFQPQKWGLFVVLRFWNSTPGCSETTSTFRQSAKIESPYIPAPLTRLCSLWQNQTRCKRKGSFSSIQDCFFVYTAIDCSLKKFARSNEPCADELNVTAGCSHTGSRIRAKMHTANAATTSKRQLVSVGMAKHLLTEIYLSFCTLWI